MDSGMSDASKKAKEAIRDHVLADHDDKTHVVDGMTISYADAGMAWTVVFDDGVEETVTVKEMLVFCADEGRKAREMDKDPLGYDTSDEDAAIRQMAVNALSGKNRDAVRAETDRIRKTYGP